MCTELELVGLSSGVWSHACTEGLPRRRVRRDPAPGTCWACFGRAARSRCCQVWASCIAYMIVGCIAACAADGSAHHRNTSAVISVGSMVAFALEDAPCMYWPDCMCEPPPNPVFGCFALMNGRIEGLTERLVSLFFLPSSCAIKSLIDTNA